MDTSARATAATAAKQMGESQIKHFAGYLLQMYPSAVYKKKMSLRPPAHCKHTGHIMSGRVYVCVHSEQMDKKQYVKRRLHFYILDCVFCPSYIA